MHTLVTEELRENFGEEGGREGGKERGREGGREGGCVRQLGGGRACRGCTYW